MKSCTICNLKFKPRKWSEYPMHYNCYLKKFEPLFWNGVVAGYIKSEYVEKDR